MKNNKKSICIIMQVFFALITITNIAQNRAENPFIKHMYTADPSAHVWDDGRLYVYPSTDVAHQQGVDKMEQYHVFSTDDMVTWKDHGEILHSKDVKWGRPEGGFMWAPDCAYKNGKYYFYYPHPSGTDWNNTWKIGVAVSKHPEKGFKDQGYMKGVGGFAMIDPSVFIDDDGQAYFYYGGGGKCAAGKLKDNMMEIDGELKLQEGLADFHEAPMVFKNKGLYYLIHSDNAQPLNNMVYATSKNPLGPWENRGFFMDVVGCSTTHGSVVEYKNQWYLFYHNKALSNEGNLRSICFDKLFFNSDGTIQKVIQTK